MNKISFSPEAWEEGYWSKRIDSKNRIVFKIVDEEIQIIQCMDHYNDK